MKHSKWRKRSKKRTFASVEGMNDVVEEANEGEVLILRTTLTGLKGHQDEQRENIFNSRCTIKGKVCSLIINSGSCTNVASVSVVEKLNLQATTHPHPYNVQRAS